MEILTTFQQELLSTIGQSPLNERFYLTGGTALSAFYLHHRFSEDLDFFTSDPTAVQNAVPILEQIAQDLNAQISFTRLMGTFLECLIERPSGEWVKLDFAQDAPYRLEPTRFNETYGILIDNATDIACNKLSALFDRAEAKDFVDVYFVCQELMPFTELDKLARKKHIGIDDYWLAIALQRVERITLLPRMIKALELEELRDFFLDRAKVIMDRVDPTSV